jgi:NAD(P)H-hydrate epimerase
MLRAFSSAEIRRVDQDAVDELGIPSLLLMENAARGVCERIQQAGVWQSITIFAGPGNNGGDGLAIARLLAARGINPHVYLIRNGKDLSQDAACNHRFLEKCGIPVEEPSLAVLPDLTARLTDQDLIVDSLLGTGTRGQLRSPFAEVVDQINLSRAMVLAVDIPTGFDCDSGLVIGPCVRADWTVTFVGLKTGFLHESASDYTGVVWVSDIGVPLKWLSDRQK